jgi:hypothetical protein
MIHEEAETMHVVAAEGDRVDRIVVSDGTVRVNTWYAGHLTSAVEPGAQAFSVGMETPHTHLRAHFHDVEQFQVFFAGSGKLGSAPLGPMAVFYTDAYTSYGPIIAGAEGLTFYTLRCEHDAGVRWMPESRALREPTPGRRIIETFDPDSAQNQADARVPGGLRRWTATSDDDGMCIEFVVAGPQTSLAPVFGATSPHQYVLLMHGEVAADGKRLFPGGLMYNEDVPQPSEVATGATGAMLAVMTFPRK